MIRNMTTEEKLSRRHEVKLQWVDPMPGVDAEGNKRDAALTTYATVADCIDMQRAARVHQGHALADMDDAGLLEDFEQVHWACIQEDS